MSVDDLNNQQRQKSDMY